MYPDISKIKMKSDISSDKFLICFPDTPERTKEERAVLSKIYQSLQPVPIGNNKTSHQSESQSPCAEKIQSSVILCKMSD